MFRPCSFIAESLKTLHSLELVADYVLMWWFSCYVLSDSYDPIECSPPGSSVHGISQARILEWVAILSFRGSSLARDQTHISCIAQILLPLSHQGSPLMI